MEKSCNSCRYNVVEDDNKICNFPLIDEKFLDGFDENPTNSSNNGADCRRFEIKENM